MAHEHPSGLPMAFDRSPANPRWNGVVFREDKITQAAEWNEVQSIIERRGRRVADLVGRDGDRVTGADIIVDVTAGTVTLSAGRLYVRGDVREVGAAVLTDVDFEGDVIVGVRLATETFTEQEDPSLAGLVTGANLESEGEPGAGRIIETLSWSLSTEAMVGDFYSVYLIRGGTPIDQTPPPALTGINQAIAIYDRDANGSYIVEGCRVTAIGKVGNDQVFSIEEGTANIFGFKRTRYSSLRFAEPEMPDTAAVVAETQTFADGGTGTATIRLNHGPISSVGSVVITKQVTEGVVRGSPNNTSDALANTSVASIVSISQGGTTYVEGADYVLGADRVDWAPGGAEPAVGSTYQVTYRYLAAVDLEDIIVGEQEITVADGLTGSAVIISYSWKMPRIDLVCLDQNGLAVYIKGESARERPMAPRAPSTVLPLAEVHNTWRGAPTIVNSGVRSVHFDELWRYLNKLVDTLDLVALERLKSDIDSREPVAKKGVFVDPLVSDFYRDGGAPQTASVFDGSLQLSINPTFHETSFTAPITLDFSEEIIIDQPLVSGCEKINPYQNFSPLPAKLTVTPSVDFWTETRDQWASAQTAVFGSGNQARTTTDTRLVDQRVEQLEFLRQREITFSIEGFAPGEILESLTFDNIDVKPAGELVADANGEISGAFMIPANVTAGQKIIRAVGMGDARGEAQFVGQGTVTVRTMQRITTTVLWQEPSPAANNGWPEAEGGGGDGGSDPQAQTFMLLENRHILGVNLKFCAKGDEANACLAEMVTVENGWPTRDVVTSAVIPMTPVVLDDWTEVRWPAPAFLPASQERAFVIKTDDADHSIAVAALGAFDPVAQEYVSQQPYFVGVRLSSSNARTWTAHQDSDVTFQIVAARFGPITKSVDLGSHALVNCSELLVRATVELPTSAASCIFEVERPSGQVIRLVAGQVFEFSEYVTEVVQLRAVLRGTETVSPTLFPGVVLIAGELQANGTYVSRAFELGTDIRMSTFMKTKLPAGSTLAVELDDGEGNWTGLDEAAVTPLNDGWIEREFRALDYSAQEGRLRITLTGTPAARPSVSDLRAVSI